MRRFTRVGGSHFFKSNTIMTHPTNIPVLRMPLRPDLRVTAAAQATHPYHQFLVRNEMPLSDHYLMTMDFRTVTSDQGDLSLQPRLPDEKWRYPADEIVTMACFNMLKRTNGRNSGFKDHNELAVKGTQSVDPYDARVAILAERLGALIQSRPTTKILLLQEAPVGEDVEKFKQQLQKYVPEGFKVGIKGSRWGVMIVVDENVFPHLLHDSKVSIAHTGPLKDRCISVDLDELSTRIDVLHAPHDHPHEAYETIIRNSQDFICREGLMKKPNFTLITVGDFNVGSEDIEHIPERAIHDIVPRAKENPLRGNCLIGTSLEGHLKQNGMTMSVDHFMTLCIHNDFPDELKRCIMAYKDKMPDQTLIPGT
jgi:hypothetical protein